MASVEAQAGDALQSNFWLRQKVCTRRACWSCRTLSGIVAGQHCALPVSFLPFFSPLPSLCSRSSLVYFHSTVVQSSYTAKCVTACRVIRRELSAVAMFPLLRLIDTSETMELCMAKSHVQEVHRSRSRELHINRC